MPDEKISTKDLRNKINKLTKENKKLRKKINEDEKILKSYGALFENIFINHELEPAGVWNKAQLLSQELLSYLDNIAKKNNLEYWLDYGTLLGAARHGGFIPWDDDVDVGMMRRDFEKIYPILKEDVEKNDLDITVKLYHQNVPGILVPFIQFSYRFPKGGTTLSYLDIFPYDFKETSKNFDQQHYKDQYNVIRDQILEGKDEKEVIKDYMDELDLTYDDSEYIIPGAEAPVELYDLNIFEKDIIFPLKEIKFKDNYYPCPNNYKKNLERIYGNYLDLPKEISMHGLLDRVKQIENVEDKYDVAIAKLKKVNESF